MSLDNLLLGQSFSLPSCKPAEYHKVLKISFNVRNLLGCDHFNESSIIVTALKCLFI